jgi:hypothetical protein
MTTRAVPNKAPVIALAWHWLQRLGKGIGITCFEVSEDIESSRRLGIHTYGTPFGGIVSAQELPDELFHIL